MKKAISLAIFAALIAGSSYAVARDLPMGTVEIGGDFDIDISSTELEIEGIEALDTDTFTLSGDVLYYFSDNLALGITAAYENAEASSGGVSSEATTLLLGPALAYNISLNPGTSLKLQGAFVLADIDMDGDSADGYGVTVAGTLAFFLGDNVSLDTTLRFVSASLEDDTFGLDFDLSGFSLGLGLTVYLQ